MGRVMQQGEHWRALFESTPDALLIADDEGRYVAANSAALELTGYSREELLSLSVWALTPDPDHQRGRALWSAFIERGRQSGKYRLRRKDGSEISVSYSAVAKAAPGLHLSLLRRADAPHEGRGELLENIREAIARTPADESTRDALLMRLTLLQELTVALAAASMPEDIVRAVFEKGRELLQIRAVSLYLAQDDELVLRGAYGLPASTMQKFGRIRKGDAVPIAEAFRGGSVLWIPAAAIFDAMYPELAGARAPSLGAWATLPLHAGGSVIGVLGLIFPDAQSWTDKQKALIEATGAIVAQALERARLLESERQARAVQQRLMAIVGHDLRNPLQAIVVGAGLLLQQARSAEVVERNAGRVLASARRMTAIIDDLLDYARAASGTGLSTVRGETDAHQVVERVVSELQAVHAGRSIRWRTSGPGLGSFDSKRLEQMVSNLVSNALYYSPHDESVEVVSVGSDQAWDFSVHNGGQAIDPGIIPRLFEPFQRGDRSSQMFGAGLGLGLFIVDAIVRAHDGTIHVRSSESEGTTFHVRLPRRA